MQVLGAVGTYGTADMVTILDLLQSIAYIDTDEVINITATTADSGGNVYYEGVTRAFGIKGLCYATTTLPTVADNVVPDVAGFGVFTATMSSLTPLTVYYVRAYGYNTAGSVFYGPEKTFTTLV
jgi:hypothetical protein